MGWRMVLRPGRFLFLSWSGKGVEVVGELEGVPEERASLETLEAAITGT